VLGGLWGRKAFAEALQTGRARVAATTETPEGRFYRVPLASDYSLDPSAAFVHVTSNNTVMGTQQRDFPETGSVPLVVDASSDILGVPFDVRRFGVLYAGAQKNMGPSGVTVVVIRRDLVDGARRDIPLIWQYRTQRDARSLANTAPTFSIYMLRNVLAWLEEQGGVEWAYAENQRKAELVYRALAARPTLYELRVEPASRSLMNVTWHMRTSELEAAFWQTAAARGLVGLKGHALVGGLRASLYNAVPLEAVRALAEFIEEFPG
jgi:phosphoserine aminotransferase